MVSGHFCESSKKVMEVCEPERPTHRLLYSKEFLIIRKKLACWRKHSPFFLQLLTLNLYMFATHMCDENLKFCSK